MRIASHTGCQWGKNIKFQCNKIRCPWSFITLAMTCIYLFKTIITKDVPIHAARINLNELNCHPWIVARVASNAVERAGCGSSCNGWRCQTRTDVTMNSKEILVSEVSLTIARILTTKMSNSTSVCWRLKKPSYWKVPNANALRDYSLTTRCRQKRNSFREPTH